MVVRGLFSGGVLALVSYPSHPMGAPSNANLLSSSESFPPAYSDKFYPVDLARPTPRFGTHLVRVVLGDGYFDAERL